MDGEKIRDMTVSKGYQDSRVQRSKLEIIADILSVAKDGAKKTEIVYRTNLNFARLSNYISYLEAQGLLENIGSVYKLTEKGRKFLCDYQRIAELCQGPR